MLWAFRVFSRYVRLLMTSQLHAKNAPVEGVKKRSNTGHRIISDEDRILLFLIRLRRSVPYELLALNFGVSESTARNYFNEMVDLFHVTLVERLMNSWTRAELESMMPDGFENDLPGAYLIFDGTGFTMENAENVLIHRILYSAYHHKPEAQVVFGTFGTSPAPCS